MRRGALGQTGEEVAVRHLVAEGMAVLARNWRCARGDVRGELDVVARDGKTLVFVEVKARRGSGAGGPLVAVTFDKQQRLRRLASAWLATSGMHAADVRFDVVGVQWPAGGGVPLVDHIRGAW